MGGEFIEQRRAALEVFLRRVAAHPLLHNSPDLRLFLQSDETEFAIESSRMAAEAGDAAPAATSGAASAARKTFNGAARLFKSLSQSAAGLTNVGGSSSSTSTHITYPREEEESVEYLKARAYFSDLENHLAEVHKQAERLVRHHGALAAALSEFSGAMAALGRHQEEEVGRQAGTPVIRSFVTLSDRAAAVAGVSKRSSEELAASFEAPMKEFMRSVRAAKKAMADRSEALAARQAARADVDAKRARLTRLRATPGLVEERVMEAERDLQTAMKTADDATKAYSNIVQRMDSDIIRFQQERVEEMKKVLTLFSQVEAKAAADSAKLWDTLGAGAMAGEESAAA
jgi:sorting nexin-1/2